MTMLINGPTAYDQRRVNETLSVYEALEKRRPDPSVDFMEINYMTGEVTTSGSIKPPNPNYGPSLWIWDYTLEWVDYNNLTAEQQRKMKALDTVGEVLEQFGEYVESCELRYYYPVFCTASEINRLLISKIGLLGGPKICHYLKLNVICRAVSVAEFKEYALKHMFAYELDIDTGCANRRIFNTFNKGVSVKDDSFEINYFEFVEDK